MIENEISKQEHTNLHFLNEKKGDLLIQLQDILNEISTFKDPDSLIFYKIRYTTKIKNTTRFYEKYFTDLYKAICCFNKQNSFSFTKVKFPKGSKVPFLVRGINKGGLPGEVVLATFNYDQIKMLYEI